MNTPPVVLCFVLLILKASIAFSGDEKIIVAFGDSITVGAWENNIKAGNGTRTGGYEPDLEALTDTYNNHYDVLNYGVAGERTMPNPDDSRGGAYRLIYDVLPRHPEASYVLIMEGTNDYWGGISKESTIYALAMMIDGCRAYGIEPVLATLTPDTTSFSGPLKNIPQYNRMITTLAEQKNVLFVDMYNLMIEKWESHYAYGLVPWGTYVDYLHPSREGYHKIANLWFAALGINKRSEIPWVYNLLR